MAEDILEKVDGTTITRSGIVNQSITYYNQAYNENLTDICDFSEGSEIRTLHESIAVELFAFYKDAYNLALKKFINTATGQYLDMIGCEHHLTRKKSQIATGSVTFTLHETLGTNYTIPKDTIILGRGTGYEYVLEQNVTIAANTLTADGTVHSKVTGSRYNSLSNTLTAFKNIEGIPKPVTVTNNSPITGGVDAETDTDFRTRILASKKERTYGTISTYTNLILDNVTEVHDVQFVAHTDKNIPKHYKSDGTICTDCTRIIIVNATSKPCPDDVLEEVQELMTLQDNLVVGHVFHVQGVTVIPLYLSITCYVETFIDVDVLVDHIQAFMDGDTIETKTGTQDYVGLNISQTLTKSRLIDVIEDVVGVTQVESIHRLKYNTSIPADITKWTKNGTSGTSYSYEDSDGYTYTRSSTKTDSINYWGEKNFNNLTLPKGRVWSIAQMTDVDSAAEAAINLVQYDDSTGEVVNSTYYE